MARMGRLNAVSNEGPRLSRHPSRGAASFAVALLCLALGACASDESQSEDPVQTEATADGRLVLTLSERAAERLNVATAQVTSTGTARVVPYGAVLYLPDGSTWIYVQQSDLTYLRESIEIDSITADGVAIALGPPTGSFVVTMGVSEFWGVESGVGE